MSERKDYPSYLDCPREPVKPTKFIGNGASCIAKFLENHKRGTVFHISQDRFIVTYDKVTMGVVWNGDLNVEHMVWLQELCCYYPPEPAWRDATNREALLAYLIDKGDVEYQITEAAPIEMDRAWHKVTTDYTAWTDPYRRYRIREDA